jgi:nucleotidyltransferase/DNA polymerase involved in DNA repair
MTVACVFIPHVSLRMALLDRPDLDGLPLALTSQPTTRTQVVDCSPEAARRGIRPGMLIREATALCPETVFIEPNPVREAMVFERMMTALETFSPNIEPEGLDRCYVDLTGLQRHYPSLEAAIDRLLSLVPPLLRPRAGVAPGKFTASVAARGAKAGQAIIVPEDDVLAFLRDIPVSWLPIDFTVAQRMERLSLRTLGDLSALPVSAVQARFGKQGREVWALASGHDDPVVHPRRRPETITEHLTLPAPSSSREMLIIGVRQLVQRAFDRSRLQRRYARQVRLQVLIEGRRSWEREMTFREPEGRDRIVEILTHRLQDLELPGPAERLILSLIDLVPEPSRQELLPGLRSRRMPNIASAARQLKRRYGTSPLYHIVEVEPWSRIPERRHALISYDP